MARSNTPKWSQRGLKSRMGKSEHGSQPRSILSTAKDERNWRRLFMDVHGDEELPYVFLGGPLEVPSVTKAMRQNFRTFQETLQATNPDYKRGYEYPGGAPANPDLRMAWNYIGERFQCLSILVEQPFKDCEHAADTLKGWSPERSKRLGAASLTALNSVIHDLR